MFLVRFIAQNTIEDLGGQRDQIRVGDPRAVEAIAGLALLVVADLGHRGRVDLGVTP
jgi:hypothetical protein